MFSKFLDPKNDIAFRRIFGREKNKDILIRFLNEVIEFNGSPIQKVTFLDPTQYPNIQEEKVSIVDILCEDEEGHRYVVEMQVGKQKGFEKRAQYYAAKVYCSQMDKGQKYATLKAVIFLAIIDFIMFPKKEDYKSDHVILDKKTYENDLKDFSFTFLELPKFNKSIDELENTTEMWMYFFKHAAETSPDDLRKLAEHDEIIHKVYAELSHFWWSEEELRTYEQCEKYKMTYMATLDQKYDEGQEKGIEIGIGIGTENIARKLLTRGDSIEEVHAVTGMSKEKITALQAKSLASTAKAYQLDLDKAQKTSIQNN